MCRSSFSWKLRAGRANRLNLIGREIAGASSASHVFLEKKKNLLGVERCRVREKSTLVSGDSWFGKLAAPVAPATRRARSAAPAWRRKEDQNVGQKLGSPQGWSMDHLVDNGGDA